MKKFFSLFLLISLASQAQENIVFSSKKNEFRVDLLSAVVYTKASISYERFFGKDFALSKSKSRYYFAEIFGSYNGGDYKEIIRIGDMAMPDYYTTQKSKYTDIGLGGSLGYKMYFHESIALEFIVGFGSNLTNRDKSPDVISRVGLNLGYRF
jgi:hypothetical protein